APRPRRPDWRLLDRALRGHPPRADGPDRSLQDRRRGGGRVGGAPDRGSYRGRGAPARRPGGGGSPRGGRGAEDRAARGAEAAPEVARRAARARAAASSPRGTP